MVSKLRSELINLWCWIKALQESIDEIKIKEPMIIDYVDQFSGMDQASIMRIAGHASTQTMRHYVRTARIQKDISENFVNVFN